MDKDDSTIARIAGNLLSGTLNHVTFADIGNGGLRSNTLMIVRGAVAVAKLITEEVTRIAPVEKS